MWTSQQQMRILDLLRRCRERVPYYRKVLSGWSGEDLTYQQFADLIPIMDKVTIRHSYDAMLSEDVDLSKTRSEYTSGSTGIPIRYPRTEVDRVRSSMSLVRRRTRWLGAMPCPDSFASYTARSVDDEVSFVKNGWLLLALRDMTDDVALEQVRRIIDYRPQILQGPSQALFRLAVAIEKNGIDLPKGTVQLIESRSEFLFEGQRRHIERMFNCKVANMYGTHECWGIAYDCPEYHLHVMEDNVFLEVVDTDGKPVGLGQEGEVLVTGLHSTTLPIVRYRVGDRVVLAERACSCGESSPYLELTGCRTSQWIRTPFGQTQPSVLWKLWWSFGQSPEYEHIVQFQLVQRSIDQFDLYLATNGPVPEHLPSWAQQQIQEALRYPVTVLVTFNRPFLTNPHSGKVSWFVSDLPSDPV